MSSDTIIPLSNATSFGIGYSNMRIYLYKNHADYNQVDKEPYLKDVLALDGNFRDVASINAPIINIKYLKGMRSSLQDDDGLSVVDNDGVLASFEVSEGNIFDYNYLYIPDLNRYYFIENISASTNNVYTLSCSVDVLMSFRDEILALEVYVDRNEFDYNADTFDNEIVISEKCDMSFEDHESTNIFGGYSIVITTVGKE